MSLFAYALLAVVAYGTIVVEAQKPTTSLAPTFWFESPQNDNTELTVSLGDNVTIACNFTDKAWSVAIVRWHPNKDSLDEKTKLRRQLRLVMDKNFDDNFAGILEQFDEFSNRISTHYDHSSGIVYFSIDNFQYEDAGDFGCYAFKGSNVSQFINLSIAVTDTIVYADVAGNQQQFIDLTTAEVQTTFNCSLYHIYGYQDAITNAWFDLCSLFDAAGNKLAEPKCDNLKQPGSFVDIRNFTDPERYGEFWPRTFQRTKITTDFPLSSSFYNRSVGCFASKNNNVIVSDFQTIVQAGVDLHLDPANFRCSAHHITVKYNEYATFSCVIQRPVYRQYNIFWEVLTKKEVKKCATDTSCRDLNGVFVTNVVNKDVNLYVTEATAKVQIKANSNTGSYKYRVVAQYLNDTKSFESDYFTFTVTGTPPTDTVKEKPLGDGASHLNVSFSCVLALAAFVLAFRM